jgi:hypothetical protein
MLSASTLRSGVSSLGLMRISNDINRRVYYLLLFAYSVKFHISETKKD